MSTSTASRDFGFGRDRRVRRRADFVRVQKTARRVVTAHFVLLVQAQPVNAADTAATSPTAPPARKAAKARLGVVVTRKIGGAVQRNRIKRLCRECFRTSPELVPDGVDLVVVARDGAHTLGLANVRTEWQAVRALLHRRAHEALATAGRPR